MAIKSPNLDDRRYDDLLTDALKLIPQYSPRWTNFSDADPGVTLVQLFAWMTEMVLYRVNHVPDKTYVHFLNFIGEERKAAQPSTTALNFYSPTAEAIEVPPYTPCSTAPLEEGVLTFLTTEALTVHQASLQQLISVKGGGLPLVQDIPINQREGASSVLLGGGQGTQLFELESEMHGLDAFTEDQYIYVGHDQFSKLMGDQSGGILRIHPKKLSKQDRFSAVELFEWEYPTAQGWMSLTKVLEEEDFAGVEQFSLLAQAPGLSQYLFSIEQPSRKKIASDSELLLVDHQDSTPYDGSQGSVLEDLPEEIREARWWIRGKLDFESWFVDQLEGFGDIYWRDDRGSERKAVLDWEMRSRGRNLELVLPDLPSIQRGWSIIISVEDGNWTAAKNKKFPAYQWYYRRGDFWEEIPKEQVQHSGNNIEIMGPLPELSPEGINVRGERIEAVSLNSLCPDLEFEVGWVRAASLMILSEDKSSKDDSSYTELFFNDDQELLPFQKSFSEPMVKQSRVLFGSDLFHNQKKEPVVLELEYSFKKGDKFVVEPIKQYALQLSYFTEDGWEVVWTEKKEFLKFSLNQLQEGQEPRSGHQKVLIHLDPSSNLKNISPTTFQYAKLVEQKGEDDKWGGSGNPWGSVQPKDEDLGPSGIALLENSNNMFQNADETTSWIRLELIQLQSKAAGKEPISLVLHGAELGVRNSPRIKLYEEDLPSPRIVQWDYRPHNLRLSKLMTRSIGRSREFYPYYSFIPLSEEEYAVYLQFDRPIPKGDNHIILFELLGASYLPKGIEMIWERLITAQKGKESWVPLKMKDKRSEEGALGSGKHRGSIQELDDLRYFSLNRSGSISFELNEPLTSRSGSWIRGRFEVKDKEEGNSGDSVELYSGGGKLPPLPPLRRIMLNTVKGVNLQRQGAERYSGLGIPHQKISLYSKDIFLLSQEENAQLFASGGFTDIRVLVERTNDDKKRREKGKRGAMLASQVFSGSTQNSQKTQYEEWRAVSESELLLCGKNDPVFTVDPVDGILCFGNGLRGRILPAGEGNVLVETYHTIKGEQANIAPNSIIGCSYPVQVTNNQPAVGGKNAEDIQEIIKRAPSLLSSRDRAVTAQDFDQIACAASEEVARAHCTAELDDDGNVNVVILSKPQEEGKLPDLFLAEGVKERVQKYLTRRCLINIRPRVQLAMFRTIDISISLRLRDNANEVQTKEQAKDWVRLFLDPYKGGLDQKGWPFGGTLYIQDISRMVSALDSVRHLSKVAIYDVSEHKHKSIPGWDLADLLDPSEDSETTKANDTRVESLHTLSLNYNELIALRRIRIMIG